MLRRLNTSGGGGGGGGGGEDGPMRVSMVPDGFVRAVEDQATDEQGEEGVSVEEKERKRLRKEQRRKEKAAAKAKSSIVHDGISSAAEPPSVPVDAALTVPSKPPRRMA